MSFGFDHSIILAGQKPDLDGMQRSFADMARLGMQQRQADMQLADMVRKQQQEKTLADVMRQNADNPAAVGPALMRAGQGKQALDWMGQQAEMETRRAQGQAAQQGLMSKRVELLSRAFRGGVKNQEDLDRAWAAAEAAGLNEVEMMGIPRAFREQDMPLYEKIGTMGVSEEDAQRNAHQLAQLKETERHNRETEKTGRINATRERQQPMIVVTGEGGAQYFADPRRPNAPAMPVTDNEGKPIVKPQSKQSHPLNVSDRNALEGLASEVKNFEGLASRFKDSYAGKGAIGETELAATQKLGSWASKEGQDFASFWSDYQSLVDLPQRNKMFGASLTPGEKASWDAAKNIRTGVDPQRVRAQMEKMISILRSKLTTRGRSLAKDGFSADAIEEYTGPLGLGGGSAQGVNAGGLSAEDKAAKQWAESNPNDPRAKEIMRRLVGR